MGDETMKKLYLLMEISFNKLITVGVFKSKKKANELCEKCNNFYSNNFFVSEVATDIFDKEGIE